jgi:hypothetical protein
MVAVSITKIISSKSWLWPRLTRGSVRSTKLFATTAAGLFIAWHLRAGNTPLTCERLDESDVNAILRPKRSQRAIALTRRRIFWIVGGGDAKCSREATACENPRVGSVSPVNMSTFCLLVICF